MRKSTLTLTNGCLILLAFLSAGWIGVKPNNLPEPNIRPGAQNSGYSLRFYGNGVNDIDRVKIQIDDPANNNPGPPADVGATDFTLEFWMKASAAENNAAPIVCGNNLDWIYGNTLFDRDRFSQDRKFGLAIAGGVFVLGVTGEGPVDYTICGTTNVLDQTWYHVAVQRRRSDGWLWLYIDGQLEVEADGPDGDISYPDDGQPRNEPTYCGGICVNDPYLVIGAEKHDVDPSEYPSYSGWIDEVRLSTVLRYSANFTPSTQPFAPDPHTAALYHFDEGSGNVLNDSSGAPGGPSQGVRQYGGTPAGPEWSTDTPIIESTTPPLPPTISGPPTVVTLATSAQISWQTNVKADSRVRHGPTCGSWAATSINPTEVTEHSLLLTGLTPDTSYCFQVQSHNAQGETPWSSSQEFTTWANELYVYLPLILKTS